MASVGQNISTVAFLNGTNNSTAINGNNTDSSASSSDNLLKEKEFSAVMEEQSEPVEKAEAPAKGQSSGSVKGDVDQNELSPNESDSELKLDNDGKTLPEEGIVLPGFVGNTVNLIQNSENPSIKSVAELLTQVIPTNTNTGEASLEIDDTGSDAQNKLVLPLAGVTKNAGENAEASRGLTMSSIQSGDKGLDLGNTKADGAITTSDQNVTLAKSTIPDHLVKTNIETKSLAAQAALATDTTKATIAVSQHNDGKSNSDTGGLNVDLNTKQNLNVSGKINTSNSAIINPLEGVKTEMITGVSKSEPNAVAQVSVLELTRQSQINPQLKTAVKNLDEISINSNSLSELGADTPSSSISTLVNSSESLMGNRPTTTFQTAVPIEVGKAGWSDGVMQKVMWMSSQQINKAEIALDPPELGPLQVRISTHGDQTSVTFISGQGSVRDALDQGVAKLREMMENQGLDLADVDVSDQRSFGQNGEAENSEENEDTDNDVANQKLDSVRDPNSESQEATVVANIALVDSYA